MKSSRCKCRLSRRNWKKRRTMMNPSRRKSARPCGRFRPCRHRRSAAGPPRYTGKATSVSCAQACIIRPPPPRKLLPDIELHTVSTIITFSSFMIHAPQNSRAPAGTPRKPYSNYNTFPNVFKPPSVLDIDLRNPAKCYRMGLRNSTPLRSFIWQKRRSPRRSTR